MKTTYSPTSYSDSVHRFGRLWTFVSLVCICAIPITIALKLGVPPKIGALLAGLLKVGVIYIPIGIIEALTFGPVLGSGASYLAFITGNLTNLKVPCTLNAIEMTGVEKGSEESDILSTLSVGASSLTTNLVLLVGVLLLIPLTPVLNSPALAPAFANVLPALFGALGYMFISQNWKLSVLPAIFVITLYLMLPTGIANTISGALVPVTVLVTIAGARVLYKKGLV